MTLQPLACGASDIAAAAHDPSGRLCPALQLHSALSASAVGSVRRSDAAMFSEVRGSLKHEAARRACSAAAVVGGFAAGFCSPVCSPVSRDAGAGLPRCDPDSCSSAGTVSLWPANCHNLWSVPGARLFRAGVRDAAGNSADLRPTSTSLFSGLVHGPVSV